MSARSIRRAAEREALKAARQTNPESTISAAQLAANRANAQLSTGPKTAEGKLSSSHNAVKTGLTGRTVLLPNDDVAAYRHLISLINQKFNPVTDAEKHLTQSIADIEWRLLRIPTIEAGLYAIGKKDLADQCQYPEALETIIFRAYQKDFRNLALQERRLRGYLKDDTAELRRIQEERLAKEREAAEKPQGKPQPKPAPAPQKNGFEFTTEPQAPQTTANTQPEPITTAENGATYAVAS